MKLDWDSCKKTLLYGGAAAMLSAAAAVLAFKSVQLPPTIPRMDWSHTLFGHRGGRFLPGIPENTIPAFAHARERGAHGFEFDVQLCKSGELVVHHDDFVGPYLNETAEHVQKAGRKEGRRIEDVTLDELRQLTYRDDKGKDGTAPIRISTLRETVVWAMKDDRRCGKSGLVTKCRILLEVKSSVGTDVQASVAQLALLFKDAELRDYLLNWCIVISFDPYLLYLLKKAVPEVQMCMLSCRDHASSMVKRHGRNAPLLYWLFPGLMDALLHGVMEYAPFVLNCRCRGPDRRNITEASVKRIVNCNSEFVYMWGFQKPANFVPWMQGMSGVSVACDDDYEKFLAGTS